MDLDHVRSGGPKRPIIEPFVALGPPNTVRVVVSADGGLAAVVEPTRIAVVRLADLVVEAEIGIEGGADANDVAFAGAPPRLVVLAHTAQRTCLYLIDPIGPRKISDLQFRAPMRIAAVSGRHVLLAGIASTAIIDVSKDVLVPTQLNSRLAISAAGAFGADRFILSVGGAFEECDSRTGAPARRFRFSEPVTAQYLGGNQRRIWSMARARSQQINLISLTGGRHPDPVELPEPTRRVAADADHDLLLVIGDRTGGGYVVDLGLRKVTALERGRIDDAAWQGGTCALVLAVSGQRLERVPWSASVEPLHPESEAEPDDDHGRVAPRPAPPSKAAPAPRPSVATDAPAPASVATAAPAPSTRPTPAPSTRATPRPMTVSERLAACRQQGRPSSSDLGATLVPPPEPPASPRAAPTVTGWREAAAAWSRGVLAGAGGPPPALDTGLLPEVAARLALDDELTRALCFLYGAHVCGHDSVAPIELSGVLGGRWDEALGGGRLASSGALVWWRSRIRLAKVIAATLDELPARTGTVVAGSVDHARTVAVVAPSTVDLPRIGAWAASIVGTLLVPVASGDRRVNTFLLEARARGVTPLVPWPWLGRLPGAAPDPAVLVVDNEQDLAGSTIAVVAHWDAR